MKKWDKTRFYGLTLNVHRDGIAQKNHIQMKENVPQLGTFRKEITLELDYVSV